MSDEEIKDFAWKIADSEVGWDEGTKKACQSRYEDELIKKAREAEREKITNLIIARKRQVAKMHSGNEEYKMSKRCILDWLEVVKMDIRELKGDGERE